MYTGDGKYIWNVSYPGQHLPKSVYAQDSESCRENVRQLNYCLYKCHNGNNNVNDRDLHCQVYGCYGSSERLKTSLGTKVCDFFMTIIVVIYSK